MKVLITGGAGFMGSFVVKGLLKEGFEIIVIDKLDYSGDIKRLEHVLNEIEFYRLDLLDYEKLRRLILEKKPSIVIHLASYTHVDRSIMFPRETIENNIIGTLNLLEAIKDISISKFVHVSTDEVYGEIFEGSFMENSVLSPSSPYASSKASSDLVVKSYYRTYKIPSIILRPTNNYGPFQYPEKLIPLTILKAVNNQKIPIYGNGKQRRTWLYVEDFVDALKLILKNGNIGEIYNISSDEEYENLEVVKKILNYLKKPFELIEFVSDRPGHDFRYSLNYEKIKSLGFIPKYKLDNGLKITIEWYLENIQWLREKYDFVNNFVSSLLRNYNKLS
ncbi:MAG: dTDP-glucose 4,6-dehydratase [candidate division WOR-3 bacterium]|nr:dTDP-glucose 4,6-dehydratase [candidate division WOR-3 bacterium]